MSVRLIAMLVVALATVVVVGIGCGGNSGSSNSAGNGGASVNSESSGESTEESAESSEGGSSAKAAFIKEATALCEEAREGAFDRISAYEEKHGGEEAVRAVLISTIATEISGIDSLEAPAGDQGEIEAMVSEMQATLSTAKANQKLDYKEIEESFGAVDKKLEAYGLVGCTKNG